MLHIVDTTYSLLQRINLLAQHSPKKTYMKCNLSYVYLWNIDCYEVKH